MMKMLRNSMDDKRNERPKLLHKQLFFTTYDEEIGEAGTAQGIVAFGGD